MTKEFNLSDWRQAVLHLIKGKAKVARYSYEEKDVKEFIRRLKEKMKLVEVYKKDKAFNDLMDSVIDKLAGDELK